MKKNFFSQLIVLISIFFLLVSFTSEAIAQHIPPGQDAGSSQRTAEEMREKAKVKEKLIRPQPEPRIRKDGDIMPETPELSRVPGTRVLIKRIIVTGVEGTKLFVKPLPGKKEE